MEKVVMNSTINNFYANKKIFVTGHTGFKGAWFITWLHDMGANIKGFSLAPDNSNALFNTISHHIRFEHVIGDITNKELLTKEIVSFKPDIVFHLAAQALVRLSYQIPALTFEVNTIGTANVLEAVKALPNKCTVIVITTDKVYENKEIDYHYTETDVLGGYDPYSASKAAAEIVVNAFRNSFFNTTNYQVHQKVIVSVRAGNVIGGGDFSTDRMIPDIITALKNNEAIVVRNPNAVRPWQHVLEPLYGYLLIGMLAYNDAVTYSGAYNFGPEKEDHLHVKDLVTLAIQCWGSGYWVDGYNANQPHEAGLLKLSINKAKKILQWQPKLNSKQSIEWTINWYKQPTENIFKYTVDQINNYRQL
jgi:CDP-glucose 4,6-dehydratase